MTPQQLQSLTRFVDSVADTHRLAHAGEPHNDAVVVPDVVVGWDDWNPQMLALWKPKAEDLERKARKSIGDSAIDAIFNAVSVAIEDGLRAGLQDYFDRRPADSPNTQTNTDRGLWPELLDSVKRDVSWAAVETVLESPGLFTDLLAYYRGGRWPCAWQGDYPSGTIVVL